jgi:hypothetical protein
VNDINMPWQPRTRQKEGEQTERQIAKQRGARAHPRSGAGGIKDDASDDDTQYEIKDANKSYTLQASEVHTLWKRAVKRGKDAHFVIYFKSVDLTCTLTITKGKR